MAGFDISLNSIAKKLNVTYSRYADDLTFSGDSAAVWMLKPLRSYLTRLGYELDPKKTNIFRKGRRQTVTGIVVNSKINIARPLRKRLRAAVYRRINGNQPFLHDKKLSDAALNGYINYLKMISPEKAGFLLTQLRGCPEWKY
jgi:retron-type reverse transcriptase